MCVRDGTHPGRSCIESPFHMVFSRPITDAEWIQYGKRIDECWDPLMQTWDACCCETLMKEICLDIEVVLFER